MSQQQDAQMRNTAEQGTETPQWMRAFLAQQERYTAQQQQRMHAMQEQHQAEIRALQATVEALQKPTESTTPTSEPTLVENQPHSFKRTKAILPDPPKFDGTRSDFEGWKSLMRDKIEVDGEVIGPKRNQFLYVASRLEGKGLQLALTFITTHRDTTDASSVKILDYLDTIFGDRHKAQRAVETLRTMKQGPKEPFSGFIPRFEKALADAGGMDWPDLVKRSHLNGAMTFELRRLAITMPVVESYSKYVDELMRVSDLYRSTMKHAPKEQQQSGQREAASADAMDWEPTRAASATSTQNNGSKEKKRARWVSQQELDRRRQEGVCIRCGGSGHYVGKCEYAAPRRPTETPLTRGSRANAGKVIEPQVEGSESEDDSKIEELN